MEECAGENIYFSKFLLLVDEKVMDLKQRTQKSALRVLEANYISLIKEVLNQKKTQIFIYIFWVKDSFKIQMKTMYLLTGGKKHILM